MIKIDSSFHPRLFCFSGFSGSGKTTLLSKLILELKEFKIGYIKHDAHGFQMDRPGKDTYVIKEHGAEVVMINDPDQEAILSGRSCFNQEKNIFLDSDVVLVEGHKNSKLPKILVVDDELKILDEIKEKRIDLPIAFVCTSKTIDHCKSFNLPSFERNDILGIANFIRSKINEINSKTPLYGLVLSGGMSSRMKRDKSEINYHGLSHVEYTYNLLSKFCPKVFVSCQKEQGELEHLKNLPQIHDRFLNCGPLGGILSAMSAHREAAWMVFATDMPLIDESLIEKILAERNPSQNATAFFNHDESRFEPLAAVYEPKCYHRMFYFLAEGKSCPQKVLYNSQIKKISITNQDKYSRQLKNANTPEDFHEISALLKGSVK